MLSTTGGDCAANYHGHLGRTRPYMTKRSSAKSCFSLAVNWRAPTNAALVAGANRTLKILCDSDRHAPSWRQAAPAVPIAPTCRTQTQRPVGNPHGHRRRGVVRVVWRLALNDSMIDFYLLQFARIRDTERGRTLRGLSPRAASPSFQNDWDPYQNF